MRSATAADSQTVELYVGLPAEFVGVNQAEILGTGIPDGHTGGGAIRCRRTSTRGGTD